MTVDWLDEHMTLREQNVLESDLLQMKTKIWNVNEAVDKKYTRSSLEDVSFDVLFSLLEIYSS